ncbi:MAG: ABC transporter ATP-binding protein, partial [Maricaulis sp.]|jgi:lipoprotein-releasing system ATP-binding protein|nr:ABC transporter ATP-binding protein [Maricaulis sp.]MDG2044969.1 ABC transporter ATP-binding protein [Maricaulis sp.]
MSKSSVLELRNITRTYVTDAGPLNVLRGVDLDLKPGELVGLVGPSGSGKSSLLHAAGLLEKPDDGDVLLAGRSTRDMTDRERTAVRRSEVGFVYQFHHLLPEFDALENIVLPQLIAGVSRSKAAARSLELLALMDLSDRADHRPGHLSGGEQQRVAIARSMANSPRVLLADEPTGNLDPHTSSTVFNAFRDLVKEQGASALVATHNHELAALMDRVVTLEDGHLSPYSAK